MKMKLQFVPVVIMLVAFVGWSCSRTQDASDTERLTSISDTLEVDVSDKGLMRYVELNDPLEEELVTEGRIVFQKKCTACHSLKDEDIVGPGIVGITNRRTPEWIMNMLLNTNAMVEVDSLAHEMWISKKVKMPDPYLPVDKARSLLEFLRYNDMEQVGEKDKGRPSE